MASVRLVYPSTKEETLASALGEVFTRPEVVAFMLDLGGYTIDKPLYTYSVLEPSCGEGDFVIPIVKRLLQCYQHHVGISEHTVTDLKDALRAVELNRFNVTHTRDRVIDELLEYGVGPDQASYLANQWILNQDFLLCELDTKFTHVFGNPPYVRLESILPDRLAAYRKSHQTMTERADLYVPFIERSLSLLAENGTLTFICADRWIKNKYGARLRALIAEQYHLHAYINLSETPAFKKEVDAYPGIFVIQNKKPSSTWVIDRSPDIADLPTLYTSLNQSREVETCDRRRSDFVNGAAPWILNSRSTQQIVSQIERNFPLINEAGCTIGIGSATGADHIFIGKKAELDVEDDRLIPLVKTKDLATGQIQWPGNFLINPYGEDGSLVNLEEFPKLRNYFHQNEERLKNRYCAKKQPDKWYKTLDRVYPSLQFTPKLLIPDIKQELFTVFDTGEFYPHHNLYYIATDDWDLRALQAVLSSDIPKLFLSSYAVKMRGGYLRMQAQYLRRLRLPKWNDVNSSVKQKLITAFTTSDSLLGNTATNEMYGL
ncbi:Eco57I restriction-modification methylase domain-containing protein [Parapedobacter deserti]|uniref:site-specific DNA-methyltransferase (adenine-specific) n=1 Tax=Parapedobacter deserti TaxID=1912957 RepID=A0ABV7JJ74_9SPHI